MNLFELFLANVVTLAVLQWLAALWLKARLETSIKHEYDRRLEALKAELGLGAEVAKQRIRALGETWQRISSFEGHLFAQGRKFAERQFEELRRTGTPGLPVSFPESLKDRLTVLAAFGSLAMNPAAVKRLEEAGLEDIAALNAEGEEVKAHLAAQRFWLGPEVDGELREFLTRLATAFSALSPAPADQAAFATTINALSSQRPTALSVLKRFAADVR